MLKKVLNFNAYLKYSCCQELYKDSMLTFLVRVVPTPVSDCLSWSVTPNLSRYLQCRKFLGFE